MKWSFVLWRQSGSFDRVPEQSTNGEQCPHTSGQRVFLFSLSAATHQQLSSQSQSYHQLQTQLSMKGSLQASGDPFCRSGPTTYQMFEIHSWETKWRWALFVILNIFKFSKQQPSGGHVVSERRRQTQLDVSDRHRPSAASFNFTHQALDAET